MPQVLRITTRGLNMFSLTAFSFFGRPSAYQTTKVNTFQTAMGSPVWSGCPSVSSALLNSFLHKWFGARKSRRRLADVSTLSESRQHAPTRIWPCEFTAVNYSLTVSQFRLAHSHKTAELYWQFDVAKTMDLHRENEWTCWSTLTENYQCTSDSLFHWVLPISEL